MIKTPQGFYQFQILKKFPEVLQGVSTKKFGNMKIWSGSKEPVDILKKYQLTVVNLKKFCKTLGIQNGEFMAPQQIHGSKVKKVEAYSNKTENDFPFVVGDTDGLVTYKTQTFLFVAVADCYPILAFEPQNKIIGIAHAGWRGTSAQIGENLILEMKSLGAAPENIVFGIGPGICVNHYEVKIDVAAKFDEKFLVKKGSKRFLDLEKVIIFQLLDNGVKKDNVEKADICTFENEDFLSNRREKTDLRFAAILGLREDKVS